LTELKHGVDFLTLIAGRKRKDEILKFLLDSGCHLIDVVYAKGSVQAGYFRDMLGLVPEEKKILVTCLIAGNLSGRLLDGLIKQFNFDKPNTGIAFTIPVDKLSV
jgi:hypothetical protein